MADKESNDNQGGGDKGGDKSGNSGTEHRGYVPLEKGWRPGVQGGYQPATSETGNPPSGGGGGKEPDKSSDKE